MNKANFFFIACFLLLANCSDSEEFESIIEDSINQNLDEEEEDTSEADDSEDTDSETEDSEVSEGMDNPDDAAAEEQGTTPDFDLVKAVNEGSEGDFIEIPPGTYVLEAPLEPKQGMSLIGSGREETIIISAATWQPGTGDLPDGGVDSDSVNKNAYLIVLHHATPNVTIANMTLTGPTLHGAIYGNNCDFLEVSNVLIKDVLWSGIRTFRMDNAKIHDSYFEDAGGKYENKTGGSLYLTWTKDSEFYNNTIYRSSDNARKVYGIKGRQGRNCRIYQNTITVNFSIEFPHEHDHDMEIDHNYLTGTVSIPKHGGGNIPESGTTFRIHHNYFTSSYALEWARNGAEVDHNLFDFSVEQDVGNLISCWTPDTPGPAKFHNNLVKNPGRGLFWSQEVYNNYEFYNNHVITNTTITPRTEGLFGFNPRTDFNTIVIKNNIIECNGMARALMRNTESYGATIENNTLTNVSDVDNFTNPNTTEPVGPDGTLSFHCGAYNAYTVDGWNITEN